MSEGNAKASDKGRRFRLELEDAGTHEGQAPRRLASLLKAALRRYGFRVLTGQELLEQQREKAHEGG